ncbi:hypothetical protein KL925_003656 [Ogataea polymorpha]|nr:hypothetical protein KL925_003656 [Ogataea polymorpha]
MGAQIEVGPQNSENLADFSNLAQLHQPYLSCYSVIIFATLKMYPDSFEGFAVTDTNNWSTVSKIEFKPKPFGEYDVDICIHACGICGSDVHTVSGGWGQPDLPVIAGHEIIGEAVRVGNKVTTVKKGQRVGVGAQIWSCLKCEVCKANLENYCPHMVDTYNSNYPDGSKAWGGYSSHIRAHEYFVFPIPDALKTEDVAPMLCAGTTTYSPLVDNGCGPGKKVAVIGIGGLGHFAIMFANALGAEVCAFSRSSKKAEDARKLGASEFVATGEDSDWPSKHQREFDLIISSSSSVENFDLDGYLGCLKVKGKFMFVGIPEDPLEVKLPTLNQSAISLSATHLGNRQQILSMLKLAADKGLKAWTECLPISEESIKHALERTHSHDVRFRFVLTDYDKKFGRQD